jgi:zinc and cadmium transporter
MERAFWAPFIASLCAAAVTGAGICAIRQYEDWALRNASYFACFAAGVLVSVSFLHIVPKAIGLSRQAPLFILAGYLLMYLFNRFITAFVCDRPATKDYALGLVPMVGIGIHSFIDGIIYSVTFSVSALTGVLVSIGMVLHEFPEGIFTYVLLRKGGLEERASLWATIFAAAFDYAARHGGFLSYYQPHRSVGPRSTACPFGRCLDLCRGKPSPADRGA